MSFRFFQDENITSGISSVSKVLAGISDGDTGIPIEQGFGLPWTKNPTFTWMDYNCWIECYLDSGIVLHKPLPYSEDTIDTLSSQFVSPIDKNAPQNKHGVNLVSKGHYVDVAQRMATSTYRFCLRGYGIRIGYQIPIPGLKTVAGVEAIYERSGPCYNRIVGNLSGIPLWLGAWELWYFVTLPPVSDQEPPPNFSEAIRGDQELPVQVQAPYSTRDYDAVPPSSIGFFGLGR